MKEVLELTGRLGNIETDPKTLVFPRVSSCVGLTMDLGQQLVGAHMTVAEKNNSTRIADLIRTLSGKYGKANSIYLTGAMNYWSGFNFKVFKTLGNNLYRFNSGAYGNVDISLNDNGGSKLQVGIRPHGQLGQFTMIDESLITLL